MSSSLALQVLSRTVRGAVLLIVIGSASAVFAQRLLCTQLPASERDRARATGQCRDPAPIIDVAPKQGASDPPADAPIRPQIPPRGAGSNAPASSAGSVAVPNVVGLGFDDARGRLTRFTLQRSYRAAAEPGGTVLAQSPMAPASVPAGAAVSLVLSDGSLVKVPRVTNVNINEARQRLQNDLDLKAQPVVITSDQRVGTVIEQQPAEGTLVKRGSVVRLQVSAGQEGPELIDVPSVIGLPFDRAKVRLARFLVERAERPRTAAPNSAPEGQVVEQAPRAPVRAAAGSVVVLTVSSAPRAAIEVFEMPNVVGRSYTEGARALAEFKISRTESDNAAPRDQIVAQTPTAGSTLLPGDAVALRVSAGPRATAASAATGTVSTAPAAPKLASGRGVLTGVLAISAAVVLGLIVGGLVMRQLLLRQRSVTAADDAITSMSQLPAQGITAVDILLEDQAAAEPEPENRSSLDQPQTEPQQKDLRSGDDEGKGSGP